MCSVGGKPFAVVHVAKTLTSTPARTCPSAIPTTAKLGPPFSGSNPEITCSTFTSHSSFITHPSRPHHVLPRVRLGDDLAHPLLVEPLEPLVPLQVLQVRPDRTVLPELLRLLRRDLAL